MTKEEIAVLGHAFFDDKTLQSFTSDGWKDYTYKSCPDLNTGMKWRIKPDEPKTITICTFVFKEGDVVQILKDSPRYLQYIGLKNRTHIKSLDQSIWWSDENI